MGTIGGGGGGGGGGLRLLSRSDGIFISFESHCCPELKFEKIFYL